MSPDTHPLYVIDTETTGLNYQTNALISIGIVTLGGKCSGEVKRFKCRPHQGAIVSPQALAVNGYTEDEIWSWPDPKDVVQEFEDWFLSTLDDGQLVKPVGWNYKFDDGFMRAWQGRVGTAAFIGNVFDPEPLEAMNVFTVQYPNFKSDPRFGNKKLTTVYQGLFQRPLKNAHNEVADAVATLDILIHIARESGSTLFTPYLQCKLPSSSLFS